MTDSQGTRKERTLVFRGKNPEPRSKPWQSTRDSCHTLLTQSRMAKANGLYLAIRARLLECEQTQARES